MPRPKAARTGPRDEPGTPAAPEFDRPERWATASAEVRKVAQWSASALAAVAGVAFGAGPIVSRVDLDVSTWSGARIAVCLTAVVVGAGGVVLVITMLIRAMLPTLVTLDDLPTAMRTRIDKDPAEWLTGDAQSLEDFQHRLKAYAAAAAGFAADAAAADNPESKAQLTRLAARQAENERIYRARRAQLLAQGEYAATNERLNGTTAAVVGIGAVLTVLGAAAYLLTLSGKAPEAPSTASGAELALLSKNESGSSDALWTALGLARCELGTKVGAPPSHSILVMKSGGHGVAADPYEVETLGQPVGCPRVSFTVIDDVAQLVVIKPEEQTITYTPAVTPYTFGSP